MAQQQKLDKTERYSLGSPQLLIGDPTVADGDGMTDYGHIPEAVITVTPNVYSASDVGGHQQAGATYGKGVDISVDLTLYDFQEAGVATFIEGASQPTEEFEAGEPFARVRADDAVDGFGREVVGGVGVVLGHRDGDVRVVRQEWLLAGTTDRQDHRTRTHAGEVTRTMGRRLHETVSHPSPAGAVSTRTRVNLTA